MADTKISAMTSAPTVANADQIPLIQGGANFRGSKAAILSGAPGENIIIQGVTGQIAGLRNFGGAAQVFVDSGNKAWVQGFAGFELSDASSVYGVFGDAVGNVTIKCTVGKALVLDCGFGLQTITLDATVGRIVCVAAGGMTVPYTDLTGGAWTPPAPLDHDAGCDRLAVAIRAMGWAGVI